MEEIKISYLEARSNDGKLLWAEGCDPDGYSYHQVIVPTSILSDRERDLAGNNDTYTHLSYANTSYLDKEMINLGEHEAKCYCRDFDNFSISIKSIVIN